MSQALPTEDMARTETDKESMTEHLEEFHGDEGLDIEALVDRTFEVREDIYNDEDLLATWISPERAGRFYQHGVDTRLSEYNERSYMSDLDTIVFPNEALAVMWVASITGDISDGAWENYGWSHSHGWEGYCRAKVTVDEELDGIKWDSKKTLEPLAFSEELTRFDDGAGLIFHVRASGVDEDYSHEDLMRDLSLLDDCSFGR